MVVTSKIQEQKSNLLPIQPKASVKWLAMLGISMGVFLFALDVYIVNLALPIMVESLHTNFVTIQWVVLSYLLAIAVFVLSAAKLGDMFNKKRLYIIGLSVFTLSSLLCAIAPNVGFLIAFRFLQGLGAAFLSGLGTAMIVEIFPPEQRGLGLGIRAGVYGFGVMLGPTIGGLLVGLGGWSSIFWVNVPIGLMAIVMVGCLVPPSASSGIRQRFDALGTLILTLVLSSFTLSMTLFQRQGFDSHPALALLVVATIGLVGFLMLEARLSEPMLDLGMFFSLEFSLGLVLRFVGNFVMAGAIFILPFFLEIVKHYSADRAGLLLAVPPVIIVLTAPLAGILSDRFGTRIVSIVGLMSIALGCLFMSTFDADLTIPNYLAGVVPYALGVGLFQSPNNSAIMGAAPQSRLGIASGLLSLSRILGQAVGVPLVGTLLSFVTLATAHLTLNIDITQAPTEALVLGMQTAFRVIAGLTILSTLMAAVFWWRHKPTLQVG